MKTSSIIGCRLFLVLPVLAVLFLVSCSDPESPPAVVDIGPPGDTPDNLLRMLARSYKEKDLEAYDECLHEDFVFVFTPDIADSLGLPPEGPWWGKTEDLNSTEIMFSSPNVTDIAFSYEYYSNWLSCVEVREDTTYSGLCCRLDPLIEVVTTVESSEDPELKFRVDSSWLDITVIPDPDTEGLWCILRIQEFKKQYLHEPIVSGSAATEPSTWGGIKSIWR